jgi:hypothetical protein
LGQQARAPRPIADQICLFVFAMGKESFPDAANTMWVQFSRETMNNPGPNRRSGSAGLSQR